jgi:hypothetical protein
MYTSLKLINYALPCGRKQQSGSGGEGETHRSKRQGWK